MVACAFAAFGLVGARRELVAQERLLGTRSVGGGAYAESITLRDGGVSQTIFAGRDSVRVTRASQFLVPVAVTSALGEQWRLDVTVFHAQGTVRYTDAAAPGVPREASLSGISDTRVRLTGRPLGEAFTLTLGLNAPTGRGSLTPDEFSALRVLAAPALAMGSAPVGAGASGTLGAVYGRQSGAWALAFGASYEHRGRYQPVAALVAGSPSSDFRPGGVMRASVGGERLVGPHRLNVTASADFFSDDKLRVAAVGTDTLTAPSALATVRLGPVFSADAQLQLAPGRLQEVVAYSTWLWRAPYARDGRTATGSSGHYLASGVRVAVPLAPGSALIVGSEGRWHSGLAVNEGLPTAGVLAANMTVGLSARRGRLTLQPYVRAQAGELRQRAIARATERRPVAGISGGVVLISRY